jgi:4-hydroxy-tetrahydrodipicolinate synthase
MKQNKFYGTGAAIVTPFKSDMSIDFGSFEKIIRYLISNNVNYVVVLGTTGEAVTLLKEEKMELINSAVKTINKEVPLVIGIGGYNTAEIIENLRTLSFDNIDALLSVTPYYNKPNQKGLYEHFKALAEKCPVPVILYNVPGRTGINMTADTTLKIAEEFKSKVIAIKEASGNIDQISKIIKYKPEGFTVISGDDSLAVPSIAIGAKGVISVVANAFPEKFTAMINAALDGNFSTAGSLHLHFLEIFSALFEEGSPAGIKAVLTTVGLCENYLRLPLTPVSPALFEKLKSLTAKI